MSYKIALAQFPGGGTSRMETNAWVTTTVRRMDRDHRISDVVSLTYNDTPITMCRNRAVLDARSSGCAYLLMIDSDVWPDRPGPNPFWGVAWDFMLGRDDHDPPATIAAPYCGPPPDECVYVFTWTSHESDTPNPSFRLEMVSREHAAIKAGVEEVAALPTGLILYDMRVFDILPPPWFRYEWGDVAESIKATTEDVYQTRNASLLKLPQYCAWDCWATHMKVKAVGKPQVVRRDEVHESLREAVLRGFDHGDRLITLRKGGSNSDDA